jgi:hypothetical protein
VTRRTRDDNRQQRLSLTFLPFQDARKPVGCFSTWLQKAAVRFLVFHLTCFFCMTNRWEESMSLEARSTLVVLICFRTSFSLTCHSTDVSCLFSLLLFSRRVGSNLRKVRRECKTNDNIDSSTLCLSMSSIGFIAPTDHVNVFGTRARTSQSLEPLATARTPHEQVSSSAGVHPGREKTNAMSTRDNVFHRTTNL